MKFWQALLVLLFVTATLHAQVPFYGVYPAWQPYYYPGATSPAQYYYPQVYYPQAYYPQAYYPQPYSAPVVVNNNNESVDSLSREVQQLNDDILELQNELTSAQAQTEFAQAQAQQAQAQTAQAQARLTEAEITPRPPMILVFKNGQHVEAQGYAVMGKILWILTDAGSQRVALSSLDAGATQRVNLQRGTSFPYLGR